MLQKVLGYCNFKHPVKTKYCNLGEIKKKIRGISYQYSWGPKMTKAPGSDKTGDRAWE